MIEDCSFGTMVIDGYTYTSDLIVFPDGTVADSWWRQSGHRLSIGDIKPLVDTGPEVIVAGTGVSGMMRPDPGLKALLAKKGIAFLAAPNRRAMTLFNEKARRLKTGGCFHLTC